ncbi:MAG: VRR-NUC domain-containing protein [Pseudomonadota bacterium]|nr:VRR-NUC domain-containing protein [Pseudomonadota bacterium]
MKTWVDEEGRLHREQRERDVEKKTCTYANACGVWHTKFKSANNRGVPDRIFIIHGETFFIEFKKPGKKTRKLQGSVIADMRAAGAQVLETDNFDEAKKYIDAFAEQW